MLNKICLRWKDGRCNALFVLMVLISLVLSIACLCVPLTIFALKVSAVPTSVAWLGVIGLGTASPKIWKAAISGLKKLFLGNSQ